MYNKNYKSTKKPTELEKDIIRKVVNIINELGKDLSEIEYRRLMAKIIKRLYILRNMVYEKKSSATDFKSENNPSKSRLSKTTGQVKKFEVKPVLNKEQNL